MRYPWQLLFHSIPFILSGWLSGNLAAQHLDLRIEDEAGVAIPYVSTYLPSAGRGALGDEAGLVNLDTKSLQPEDTIVLSCLSYRPDTLLFAEVRDKTDTTIVLAEEPYELAGVTISAAIIKYKRKRLGDIRRPNNAAFDVTQLLPPGEIGKIIEVDRPVRVDSLTIYIDQSEIDSFMVEVNIYDYQLKYPGRALQNERLIFSVVSHTDEYVFDLTARPLTLDKDVLVTLKALRYPQDLQKGVLLIGARIGTHRGLQRRPDGAWSRPYVSPAMTLHVRVPK